MVLQGPVPHKPFCQKIPELSCCALVSSMASLHMPSKLNYYPQDYMLALLLTTSIRTQNLRLLFVLWAILPLIDLNGFKQDHVHLCKTQDCNRRVQDQMRLDPEALSAALLSGQHYCLCKGSRNKILALTNAHVLNCMQDDREKKWRIQAVAISPDSFDSRKALPAEWRGLRDQELSKESGIPDCVFVHASGFIGGHATEPGALLMARKALAR